MPGDRAVKAIVITCIGLNAAAVIAGLATHQLLLFTTIINGFSGMLIISYCVWDQRRPRQRVTERRELIVLLLEALCVAAALHAVTAASLHRSLVILQYTIFIIHSVLLVLFLLFMLTFKIKKLF